MHPPEAPSNSPERVQDLDGRDAGQGTEPRAADSEAKAQKVEAALQTEIRA